MIQKKTHRKGLSKFYKNRSNSKLKKYISSPVVILFGIIVLFNLLLLGWVYSATYQPKKPIVIGKWPTPTASQPTPTTVPFKNSVEVKDYKIRFFDPKDSFFKWDKVNQGYPAELTNVPSSDLTEMSCTKLYDYNYFQEKLAVINENLLLSDPTLQSYVNILNSKYNPKYVQRIMACDTKRGKTIVFYGMTTGGAGNYWGTPYIGIDTGSGIKNVQQISWGGCTPLQLVKDTFLYVTCGAGEGGGGESSIYQLNLENNSVTRLLLCQGGSTVNSQLYQSGIHARCE